jgi:methyl-accepting chemotaxis protein
MVVAMRIANSIAGPIRQIVDRMRTLAEGDKESTIPYQDRSDEIGDIARALVVFRQAEEEAIGRERSMVVEFVGTGMSKLAAKDITFRLGDGLPDAYQAIKVDFNAAMDELEHAIKGVLAGADDIRSGTTEIVNSSDELARRTEIQAANLTQTSTAVSEITSTVAKTAEGASQARQVVGSAKSDAQKGGEVVCNAIEAMNELEKTSKEISQIIGVIDEIAFQTNLLALNAGVEAARAGEAGRGFSVVATEVRSLAQRSAEAAQQVEQLISKSSSQVEASVSLVRESGVSFDRIMDRVTEVGAVVSEIASSAEQQAGSLIEVNSAVSQLDNLTQENAGMVEEATAATRLLADQCSMLADLVESFETNANPARGVQRSSTAGNFGSTLGGMRSKAA